MFRRFLRLVSLMEDYMVSIYISEIDILSQVFQKNQIHVRLDCPTSKLDLNPLICQDQTLRLVSCLTIVC